MKSEFKAGDKATLYAWGDQMPYEVINVSKNGLFIWARPMLKRLKPGKTLFDEGDIWDVVPRSRQAADTFIRRVNMKYYMKKTDFELIVGAWDIVYRISAEVAARTKSKEQAEVKAKALSGAGIKPKKKKKKKKPKAKKPKGKANGPAVVSVPVVPVVPVVAEQPDPGSEGCLAA